MSREFVLSRSQLLARLKTIQPVVIDLVITDDMGIECSIAKKEGVVYPEPGMFLFCGGYWPINKSISSNELFGNEQVSYLLRTAEDEELNYINITELEEDFFQMFGVDTRWEEMSDSDLMSWYEEIISEGKSIIEMTDYFEK